MHISGAQRPSVDNRGALTLVMAVSFGWVRGASSTCALAHDGDAPSNTTAMPPPSDRRALLAEVQASN